MQLGALGIMTLSSSILLFVRGDLDFGKRLMASKLSESFTLTEIEHVLFFIVAYTFITEIIGALLLFPAFLIDGHSISSAMYLAIFHAVSAFCNAGFSTFDNSLMSAGPTVKTVVMLLIIAGGLGFYVIFDLVRALKEKSRLRIHTKAVLLTSLVLIISGACFFFFIEFGHISVLDALFQSVTARTAGFNTVDIPSMHKVSMIVIILLMFVGASPGSTGGGLKTTTVFLALVSIRKTIIGATGVVIFGRTMPPSNILKAFTLIFLYTVVVTTATTLFLFFDDLNFLHTLFEVASAVGTVGLSAGITAEADTAGKLILTICMFIGRIGPSAFLIFMLGTKRESRLSYPEEKLILG
jgi:trk system potassium uptake protein TrkH